MTQIQHLIYNYILKSQPICDKCIAENFGYSHPQQANTTCRELRDLKLIIRPKRKCPKCNRNVLVNL